ncbi:MAG TPA: regulatory iron-sulfur-containing complex subunit RicT [Panacibacter sp.]|nr:regulatory iron-sulfur-containing complex subunit RicT [Panacibacter sp.]
MGCGTCGTGKPNGCKSNGGCSTGGCNRMNVHDWLMNLPFSDPESSCKIIEVSFNKGSRKEFFRNNSLQYFEKGEYITVEGVNGFDVGEVSLSGELVRIQMKKKGFDEMNPDTKKILRRSTEKDIELHLQNKAREKEALSRSRAIARHLNLQMKLIEIEFQSDGKKATFFYTAEDRVDFRELIKIYASEFKVKVEMRQIGIRQEAAKVGGIGSCGRELCCSTWLSDFKSVTTTAARYQNLSINQTKLSGQCGRLKCCLNYELDTYLDALQHFPDNAEVLYTTKGNASLIKRDIFRNLMWYTLPEGSKHYPLSIVRVKEILSINARSERVDELQPVDLSSNKLTEPEHAFVDVVGQISLNSLEKSSRRRKEKQRENDNRQRPKPPAGNSNTGRQPEQRKPVRPNTPQQPPQQQQQQRPQQRQQQQQRPQQQRPQQQQRPPQQPQQGRRPQPPGNPPADKK